jgi:hypothetical protein
MGRKAVADSATSQRERGPVWRMRLYFAIFQPKHRKWLRHRERGGAIDVFGLRGAGCVWK